MSNQVDEVDVGEEDVVYGFGPDFSRHCAQVFKAAELGAFLTHAEFRENLRIAGLYLGPDVVEAPRFELPLPPEEPFDDPAFDDVDDEGEDS